ncbi:Gfo/Idh/MocA family oxidoreductase [soil metagenome]
MASLRIAVLGAGFMGGTHARAFHKLEDIEIAAIYAQTGTRAEPLAAEVGSRRTDDLASILDDDSIDAVDICLPTPEHRSATEAALAAGKHVLLEKPLSLSMEDAEAIVKASDASDRIVMVAHVLRFWPEYVELKRIIDSGELGRPRFVSAARRQPAPNWTDGGPRGHLTGGSLHDMMIHDFDAANWIMGAPASAYAIGAFNPKNEAVDQAQITVSYDGGSATIDGGSMMPESYPFTSRFEVLCDNGAVEYHFRAGGRSFEVGEPTNVLTVYRNEGDPEVVEVEQSDPYENEIAYFVDCVRNGHSADRANPADALAAMHVSIAAQASVASGNPGTIDT